MEGNMATTDEAIQQPGAVNNNPELGPESKPDKRLPIFIAAGALTLGAAGCGTAEHQSANDIHSDALAAGHVLNNNAPNSNLTPDSRLSTAQLTNGHRQATSQRGNSSTRKSTYSTVTRTIGE